MGLFRKNGEDGNLRERERRLADAIMRLREEIARKDGEIETLKRRVRELEKKDGRE